MRVLSYKPLLPRRLAGTAVLLLFGIIGTNGCCRAQSAAPIRLEADVDARALLGMAGVAGGNLYSTELRLETRLAPALTVIACGSRVGGRDGLQQAVVETNWGMQRVQAGIVRVPFGIYDTRETYASGLIDYPLARGGYENHTVDWGVPGVQVIGEAGRFQMEAAGFSGRGVRTGNAESVVSGGALRVQTYGPGVIIGVSRWDGSLGSEDSGGPSAPVHLNGLDLRCTRAHLLVRGEYLFGAQGGDRMRGWYLDTYYRLPQLEKVTLVARWELLRPGLDDPTERQVTLGARFVANRDWTLAANWQRSSGGTGYPGSSGRQGELLLQVYCRLHD